MGRPAIGYLIVLILLEQHYTCIVGNDEKSNDGIDHGLALGLGDGFADGSALSIQFKFLI